MTTYFERVKNTAESLRGAAAIRGRRYYRLARRKTRHWPIWVAIRLFRWGFLARFKLSQAISLLSRLSASIFGSILAFIFAFLVPRSFTETGFPSASGVHEACAGIIGTALALVLTLSIIPAQKAADVFSSAILKLYARDRLTTAVFSLLSCFALLSLLFGTGWTFGISERYLLPLQFIVMGLSFDALRTFYVRALDLLIPATALRLVRQECERSIAQITRRVDIIVWAYQIFENDRQHTAAYKHQLHKQSGLPKAILIWIKQLEEFANKGLARLDTQGVSDILATMAEIAIKYAEARRDSIMLYPDFTGGLPIGVSDLRDVTGPICESIYNICKDASKNGNERVVQSCFHALGRIAANAITLIHTANGHKTAPLAYTVVYYCQICIDAAAKSKMPDALRAAIQVPQIVFGGIGIGLDTKAEEATALEMLLKIAMASYAQQSMVGSFDAVKTMLQVAHHDIRVKGFDDMSTINSVLPLLPNLVALDVAMERLGDRKLQIFPPYDMSFGSSIPMLLAEVASQAKFQHAKSWIDPYRGFAEASEICVRHYREVADLVSFDGTLLERWVIDSLFKCVTTHLYLMDNAEDAARPFIGTVEDRLSWVIYASGFYFREGVNFNYKHAVEACERLAVLAMGLLQRQRLDLALACVKSIGGISCKCLALKNPAGYQNYGFAECLVELEMVARAADALGYADLAVTYRNHCGRPESIAEPEWPVFADALSNRIRHREQELRGRGRWRDGQDSSVDALRSILADHPPYNGPPSTPSGK